MLTSLMPVLAGWLTWGMFSAAPDVGAPMSASSIAAPSVRLLQDRSDREGLHLRLELRHPTLRGDFTGILVELTCQQDTTTVRPLLLIAAPGHEADNHRRTHDLDLAATAFMPAPLAPKETMVLDVTVPRSSDLPALSCDDVSLRGAWSAQSPID